MNGAADLKLFFSPVTRLMHTMTPATLKSEIGIELDEPCFAFGSGELHSTPIDNMDDLLRHVTHEEKGVYLVRLSCIDHQELLDQSIKYGLNISDQTGSIKVDGAQIDFTIDSASASYAALKQQQKYSR